MKRRNEHGQVLWGILGVVVVVGIVLGVYFAVFATSGVRGRVALHNNLRTPTQQQFNYEYFHNTCNDVIAKTQQISTMKATLKDLEAHPPANDPFGNYAESVQQQRTDVEGVSNALASEANDYNAKSNEWTRDYMKSKNLPASINPPYVGITCEQGANG